MISSSEVRIHPCRRWLARLPLESGEARGTRTVLQCCFARATAGTEPSLLSTGGTNQTVCRTRGERALCLWIRLLVQQGLSYVAGCLVSWEPPSKRATVLRSTLLRRRTRSALKVLKSRDTARALPSQPDTGREVTRESRVASCLWSTESNDHSFSARLDPPRLDLKSLTARLLKAIGRPNKQTWPRPLRPRRPRSRRSLLSRATQPSMQGHKSARAATLRRCQQCRTSTTRRSSQRRRRLPSCTMAGCRIGPSRLSSLSAQSSPMAGTAARQNPRSSRRLHCRTMRPLLLQRNSSRATALGRAPQRPPRVLPRCLPAFSPLPTHLRLRQHFPAASASVGTRSARRLVRQALRPLRMPLQEQRRTLSTHRRST